TVKLVGTGSAEGLSAVGSACKCPETPAHTATITRMEVQWFRLISSPLIASGPSMGPQRRTHSIRWRDHCNRAARIDDRDGGASDDDPRVKIGNSPRRPVRGGIGGRILEPGNGHRRELIVPARRLDPGRQFPSY